MHIGSDSWKTFVSDGLKELGVQAEGDMINALSRHAEEMLLWNRKTNLTAIVDPKDVAVKHILDSALTLKHIPDQASLLDIGTGGGFPGIPVKILKPSVDLTLIDASRKKINFLKHVIRTLGLKRAVALQARGEALSADNQYAGMFDCIVCRAFSGLDIYVDMAVPFLKRGGLILAMKGREAEQELDLVSKVTTETSDGTVVTGNDLSVDIYQYQLPYVNVNRAVISVRLKDW